MEIISETAVIIKKITRPVTGRPTTGRNTYERNIASGKNNNNIVEIDEETKSINLKEKEIQDHAKLVQNNMGQTQTNFPTLSKIEERLITHLKDVRYVIDSNLISDQKSVLEKIINEENERIEIFNTQKNKLKDIELIEKDINGLYNWGSLFSKTRPITAYTCTNSKYNYYEEEKNQSVTVKNSKDNQSIKDLKKTENIKSKSQAFVFPVALIDEKENAVNDFIEVKKYGEFKKGKKNKSKSKTQNNNMSQKDILKDQSLKQSRSNAARPQSVYANRKDTDVYYLDKAFSEYYTQEESKFAEKFPLLHAKVKCNKKKLKTTLAEVKKANIKFDEASGKIKDETTEEVKIEQKDLNLAGNSKNPIPLLKSIYKQVNPDVSEEPMPSNKIYPISNKPIGNSSTDGIDLKINVRNSNMAAFLHKFNRIRSANILSNRQELQLDMYNIDDPDIKIFDRIEEKILEDDLPNIMDKIENIAEIEEELKDELIFNEAHDDFFSREVKIDSNRVKKNSFPQTRPFSSFRPKTAINKNTSNTNKASNYNTFNKNLKVKPYTAKGIRNLVSIGTNTWAKAIERSISPTEKSVNLKLPKANKLSINEMVNDGGQSEYMTPKYRTIRAKNKPSAQPHAYRMLQMRNIKNAQKGNSRHMYVNLMDSVLQARNINDEIKEDMKRISESIISNETRDIKVRPKTSIDFMKMRPFSKYSKENSKIFILFLDVKKEIPKPILYTAKLNNMYFNDYIDMQFKTKHSIITSTKI